MERSRLARQGAPRGVRMWTPALEAHGMEWALDILDILCIMHTDLLNEALVQL